MPNDALRDKDRAIIPSPDPAHHHHSAYTVRGCGGLRRTSAKRGAHRRNNTGKDGRTQRTQREKITPRKERRRRAATNAMGEGQWEVQHAQVAASSASTFQRSCQGAMAHWTPPKTCQLDTDQVETPSFAFGNLYACSRERVWRVFLHPPHQGSTQRPLRRE